MLIVTSRGFKVTRKIKEIAAYQPMAIKKIPQPSKKPSKYVFLFVLTSKLDLVHKNLCVCVCVCEAVPLCS